MNWLQHTLEQLQRDQRLRTEAILQYRSATEATLDGRAVTVFCANDYLGLRTHPALAAAAAQAARDHGTGTGASRLVSGDLPIHREAERALAAFVQQPAALLFPSGFGTNAGSIPALAGTDDVLFSDALNHASIVDGCRLSRARTVVFPHNDLDALARAIERTRPFRRGWILTESLFSMDGDLAPLADLRALADRHELGLYVDDAHALGVYGPGGAGALAAQNVRADALVATLGKSLGSGGAFIAGSETLRAYLWNTARSYVFSTGLTPTNTAAALAALQLITSQPQLRERLHANTRQLREGLARIGIHPAGDALAPIVPVVLGDETRALALSEALLGDGLFVRAIRPPTVPAGTSRLRLTVSAAHTPEQIDHLLDSLRRHG